MHDVAAQLLNKLVSLDSIKKISKNIFVPIVVSGGIRSIEDIKKILENGGSKVSINSNALANPEFINKVVNIFGSSVVSVSIDVGKINSKYYAFSVGGRECSGKDPVNWAKEAEERGAGEIILTSIENEGAGKGYNLDLIKKISSSVGIRVIANGGVGNIDNIFDLFDKTKAGVASMASILHYSLLKKNNKFRGYDEEGSHAFLMKKNFNFKKFENFFIQDIKDKLKKKNINIR